MSLPGSPAGARPDSVPVVGSAESLVSRVLVEQGLGKYCDTEFIKNTSREMQEALDMTQEEMDRAAHQIMLQERQQKQLANPVLDVISGPPHQHPMHQPQVQQPRQPNASAQRL